MELATALIWALRILLPIILFCIYFKLQSPKDELSGPTGESYSRGLLLEHRKAVAQGGPVPEELADVSTKDQTQAPALFVHNRPLRGAPASGGRRDRDRDREGGGGPPRERRERRDKLLIEGGSGRKAAEKEARAAEDAEAARTAAEERNKMHLEALLNYMAFTKGDQQRFFLPDEETIPPPPPKTRARAPSMLAGGGAGPSLSVFSSSPEGGGAASGPVEVAGGGAAASAETANAEAQMVLTGACNFKRGGVAKSIYTQLLDSQVEINERTLTLMIEASVLAHDLKNASDFLMKLESSGYSADSDLLDKVMDLYSLQKSQREQDRQAAAAAKAEAARPAASHQPPASGSMEALDLIMSQHLAQKDPELRTRLCSSAPVFVPIGVPPPPPKPQQQQQQAPPEGEEAEQPAQSAVAAAPSDGSQAADGGAVEAAEGDEADAGGPAAAAASPPPPPPPLPSECEEPQRTKLTAAAKPFEPLLNMSFDPSMFTWSMQPEMGEQIGHYQSEGKRRGGGQGKVKDKARDTKDAAWEDYAPGGRAPTRSHGDSPKAPHKPPGALTWKVKETN